MRGSSPGPTSRASAFWSCFPLLGLSVPLLFKAFSWTFMLNQNSGIINSVLKILLGAGAPVLNVDTMGGLIFVQSFTNVPIVYLITLAAMKSLDSSLEEASRVSGRGTLSTFGSVTLPLVRPAVVSAFLLAIIGGVGAFEFPFILGQPGGLQLSGDRGLLLRAAESSSRVRERG